MQRSKRQGPDTIIRGQLRVSNEKSAKENALIVILDPSIDGGQYCWEVFVNGRMQTVTEVGLYMRSDPLEEMP